MDEELASLVAAAMAAVAGNAAAALSGGVRPGEPDWLARVARLRVQQDAQALEAALAAGQIDAGPEVADSSYRTIEVDGDTIMARVYRPHGGDRPRPALVFFHGGGWWMGGGAVGFVLNDGLCRRLCDALNAVVVNVDYRLAPEHPFPVQLEDAYDAVQWVVDNSTELEVDRQRIGVVGISSGGNLSAALGLLARDRGGPHLCVVGLYAAALDMTMSSPSMQAEPAIANVREILRSYYVRQEDPTHPYLSPLLAHDLRGLPPTIVITGSYDPLRDDGRLYVERLQEAGVPARLLDYPATHTVATPAVRKQRDEDLVAALREHLCPDEETAEEVSA